MKDKEKELYKIHQKGRQKTLQKRPQGSAPSSTNEPGDTTQKNLKKTK